MAPEAPEIPTTILLVMRARGRSGSCPGVGGARSPHPPAAHPLHPGIPAAAGPRARGSRAPRSPVPPAALPRRPTRSARSGGVSLGSFLGGPVAHPHISPPVAQKGVDLPVVGQRVDDLSDEEDVITRRALLADSAPHHGKAARTSRRRAARLFEGVGP